MYIDENLMKEYLSDEKKFEVLCKQKGDIVKWWFKTEKCLSLLFKCVSEKSVDFYQYKKQDDGGRDVLNKMINENNGKDLFKAYSFVFGGVEFDNNNNALVVDPRLVKIASGGNDFSNDIFSPISKKATYNLLTNNYPNNLVCFLKDIKEKDIKKNINESGIAISHPWDIMGEKYCEDNKGWRDKISNDFLTTNFKKINERFPLKFLWMWANKDDVIHPLSLMAFREFLKSEFMLQVFTTKQKDLNRLGNNINEYAEKITNSDFNNFVRVWKVISKEILEEFGQIQDKEICMEKSKMTLDSKQQISLLISLLTLGETDMANIDELLKTHKQIILYGVPGTGKTHSAKELIKKWGKEAFQNTQEESKKEDDLKKWQFSEITNTQNTQNTQKDKKLDFPIIWDIMQFHPNTTYQDFIGGIIPKTGANKNLTYEVESGKFKKFCKYASVNSQTPFVFIIDEINRANLSEVLGELLYALEYRDEGITIPNFKEPFVIPSNVYIIGTMNNVDKSLLTFDLALRRRFGFYEVGVDCDVIEKMLEGKVKDSTLEIYIERCRDLNALISGEVEGEDSERLKSEEKLNLEKHYKIGQAYFAKIEKFLQKGEAINPNHLRKLWDYHLQPLIEEYIGFSMNDKEISNKLKRLKDFWTKKLPEESE